MNGGTLLSTATFPVGNEWFFIGAGDVNADGRADFGHGAGPGWSWSGL